MVLGQRAIVFRWDELHRIYTAWSDDFLSQPAHLRINGRPVCSFLNLTDFVRAYGLRNFAMVLRSARHVIRMKLNADPFIIGLFGTSSRRNAWLANQLDVDAASGYGLLPDWLGAPVQDYAGLIRQRVHDWYRLQRSLRVPFLPVVCCGWDASMRGAQAPSLIATPGFPWRPIVTGATPELFGEFMDEAIKFNMSMHPRLNVVFLHAWNEWSEQSVLEPSNRFGYDLLNQVAMRA
jgi:hypothetical protein